MEATAIIVAIIGAAATIIAAIITVALTHLLRTDKSASQAAASHPDCSPIDRASSVKVSGWLSWPEGRRVRKEQVKGTISKTHLALEWQEVWPDGTWVGRLQGNSEDGVTFDGVYSYPPRDTNLRTFEFRKHSSATGIALTGTWRNPDPKNKGEDTWTAELQPIDR